MYLQTFKPTFLYIKQHSETGKLYFGKTCQSNVERYKGSGSYWRKHINKHGRNKVETLWYCLFNTKEECSQFALSFSLQENIVESDKWANLKPENGLEGGDTTFNKTNYKMPARSAEWKAKQRASHLGRKDTAEGLLNRSIAHTGAKNPRAKDWTVEFLNGETKIISALKTWCRENNFSFDRLAKTKNTGLFYNDMRVI